MLIDQVDKTEPKLSDQVEGPVLSSMSFCQINRECGLNLPETAFETQLLLELQQTTAMLVTKKQFELLLFILGQCHYKLFEKKPCFSTVLKLFNKYDTSSVDNFKSMLQELQFPYKYNQDKSLTQNRRDFKNFFLV